MIRLLLAGLLTCAPALAHDNGQYENVSPEVRAWFRAQKSPKTGALCCNEADGLYAEEDIRDGHCRTRGGALHYFYDSSRGGHGAGGRHQWREGRCLRSNSGMTM